MPKGMRKIVVDDVEYRWQVGRSYVLIRGPNNFRRLVDKVEATMGRYDWRAFEKRYARILPSMIAAWIANEVNKEPIAQR